MNKVMFVGGGKRVSLANLFIEAGCDIYSYEIDETAPIKKVAIDVIKGLPFNDSEFVTHLSNQLKAHKIDTIVALQDAAVVICSEIIGDYGNSLRFPNKLTAYTCYDKLALDAFLKMNFPELRIPSDGTTNEMIMKPRFGCGSKGHKRISRFSEVSREGSQNYLVQNYLTEIVEFSVDAMFVSGKLLNEGIRSRDKVLDGEVVDSTLIDDAEIRDATRKLGKALGYSGVACLQFVRTKIGNKLYLMEINPRFGGGAVLSIAAGLDMINFVLGKTFNNTAPKKLAMKRFHSEYFYVPN